MFEGLKVGVVILLFALVTFYVFKKNEDRKIRMTDPQINKEIELIIEEYRSK